MGKLASPSQRAGSELCDRHLAPNALCADLNDRTPVILAPESWPVELREQPTDPRQVKALLALKFSRGMMCWPLSPRVGSVKNNEPSLSAPIAA